jgi:hypothetical protein
LLDGETVEQLAKLCHLDVAEPPTETSSFEDAESQSANIDINNILTGQEALQISHAGGEFMSILLKDFRMGVRWAYDKFFLELSSDSLSSFSQDKV